MSASSDAGGAAVRMGHDVTGSLGAATPSAVWWGTTRVRRGEPRCWRLGPLSLWVEALAHEWRVTHRHDPDPMVAALEIGVPCEPPPDGVAIARFGSSEPGDSVTLAPALADRPIVTRPAEPFALLPGESVEVFVSSPVWVVVTLGSRKVPALEVPSQRPTDTWFGPSTREGELCYATRTSCRLDRSELPRRPHRATTPVMLRNRADTVLHVDRISIPVQHLSLYAGPGGQLFTEPLTLERREDGEGLAELRIGTHAPEASGPAVRVAAPRQVRPHGRLIRVFSGLF